MKFKQYLTEGSYNNWCFPKEVDMKSDFAEYKVKEDYKWEDRAKWNGFRFPIFNNYNHYKQSLKGGKVVILTPSLDAKTPATDYTSMDVLRDRVNSYHRPRDLDRIIKGFETNQKIPYPVFLKGSKGYFRLCGNTRTNAATILGIKVKILIVDVSI